MGIYVKGMEMPESCYKCKLDLRTDACPAFDEWHKKHPYSIRSKDRLPDCPLVEVPEPHGRLIDTDKLMDDVKKNSASYFADDFAREWVDVQPTVIEAEGE